MADTANESDDRSWVPVIVEQRLDALEHTFSVLGEWADAPLPRDPRPALPEREAEEAMAVGWDELLDLIREPSVPQPTRARFTDACVEVVDLWRGAELPRPYEDLVERVARSALELDENYFIPEDHDPDDWEEDGDPWYVPWWFW